MSCFYDNRFMIINDVDVVDLDDCSKSFFIERLGRGRGYVVGSIFGVLIIEEEWE